jgi:16S rRNA (cytidine1402-2'-O)-methyltransferase
MSTDETAGPRRGRLVLVGTPIGNLGDVSARTITALGAADVVAAEDTRRSGRLLAHLEIDKPLVSYHDHNERSRTAPLLDRVEGGEVVAVVTDAGTPGLADPGFRLVREAIARGLSVEAIPGPAAAVQALVLSGLPMDRFVFEGFLPRKAGARAERLTELAGEARTMVFYVSPHRAADELRAMAEGLGDREAAVARELTKLHEQVLHGSLSTLAQAAEDGLRGELTVVVAGVDQAAAEVAGEDLVDRVRGLVATGVDRKVAMRQVAKAAEVPRRRVYQALLDAGGDGPGG